MIDGALHEVDWDKMPFIVAYPGHRRFYYDECRKRYRTALFQLENEGKVIFMYWENLKKIFSKLVI